jgi:uncharacterized membrane protein
MGVWGQATPAIAAAFAASVVEVVEAFTIVLAIGTTRGWRPALWGLAAALVVLAEVVAALGPALTLIPIQALQLLVGVLLLLFGLGWLRKDILRQAGVMALHDEALIFERETASLSQGTASGQSQAWIAGLASFKAVLLEGLEVAFIVVAIGAGKGLLWQASLGALAACVLVLVVGFALHRPLTRVPENALKFGVGVMLAAFGLFWCVEGLGGARPLADLTLMPLGLVVLLAALGFVVVLRRVSDARRQKEVAS